ncbi:MAG: DUF4956 domain-containing protein [Oscillospiraceae bacterium]|jgi:hypothetical protein|nr:DUF4956 domain-containing protein [Oscillospiraceae bacterium]
MSKVVSILAEGFSPDIFAREISVYGLAATLAVALLCAGIVYCTYRFFFRGVVYSENFNLLIVLVTLITALIIMTISSNLVLSLGMVGALSIVRFRAAIKDPLDVGFLFWGICAGLTAGAGLYLIAVGGSLFLAVLYMLMVLLRRRRHDYLLVLSYDAQAQAAVDAALAGLRAQLKSKTVTPQGVELILELTGAKGHQAALDRLGQTQGVASAALMAYNGDYQN